MSTLLVTHAALLASMDDAGSRWEDGAILVHDNRIAQIGPSETLPQEADRVIDARNLIVIPGLVNTHHHFYQTLTRCIPGAQDAGLFDWLTVLYPIWANLTPEGLRSATAMTIVELMRSGCTTASDHTYIWPNGARVDDQVQVAADLGFRFHALRGSMSVGQSKGGLPPDHVVEDEGAILRDSRRLIEAYHDPKPFAMTRIALAPCSPFSVSPELMRESIALARAYGVHAHTHLAETVDEQAYCLERFGLRPVELAESLGWTGTDVWHAHMIHPSADEIRRLGASRTGVAHCPTSNMRVAAGIAPLRALQRAGARVGLGADGAAANDASHLLAEARQALLLHRAMGGPGALTVHEALRLATRGGAEALGREDIGHLAVGMAADFVGYRADTVAMAGGAVHDPLAALILCQPPSVDLSVINGRVRIEGGEVLGVDLPALIARHNRLARAMVRGERA